MIELRSATGELDFSRVTPQIIEAMDEPRQRALLELMRCVEIKDAGVERRNVAAKRVYAAIADEDAKRQIHEDASSPIPFSTAKIEEQLGRSLTASDRQQARAQHAVRVRGHLEDEARQRARASYMASH